MFLQFQKLARERLSFVPWRTMMRWSPQMALTRGMSVGSGADEPLMDYFRINEKQLPRLFRTDGPIRPAITNECIAIPPAAEDLTTFYDAIAKNHFLLCYGPRQSGKTTCLLALAQRIPVDLGLRVRVVNFKGFPATLALIGFQSKLDEFLSELVMDDDSVLLVDDFDFLMKTPIYLGDHLIEPWAIARDAILRALRSRKSMSPRSSAIAFGTATIRNYQTSSGAPFDIATFAPVPTFTLEQTRELFAQFERERGVPVDADVVADIHTWTHGYRGLVGRVGQFMERITEESIFPPWEKTVTPQYWAGVRNKFLDYVQGSPLFVSQHADISEINPLVSPADVVNVTARIPAGGTLPLCDAEAADKRGVVDMLLDTGVLAASLAGPHPSIALGPPVLQRVVGFLFRPKRSTIPSEVLRSTPALLKAVIELAMPAVHACWAGGCVKVCHSLGAPRECPSEDAYAIAVHAVLSGVLSPSGIEPQTGPGFARRAPDVQAAAFDLEIDMPTFLDGGRTFIAYAAHAGPAELEARVRRLEECLLAAPGPRAWVISFEFSDVMESRPPPPPSPHVNVLCVYYDVDVSQTVTFVHVPSPKRKTQIN